MFVATAARFRFLALGLFVSALALSSMLPARARAQAPRASAQAQERVKAPEFEEGNDWLNIDKPLSLKQLKGKIVVLDFWTLC